MFTFIYPISFILCLLSLIMWFYFKGSRYSLKMSFSFLGFFALYILSLAMASPDASNPLIYKLMILGRDFAILAIVSTFFNRFKKNKIAFFGLFALMLGILWFAYVPVLRNTFQPAKAKLDKQAEFLLEIKEDHKIADLQSIINKYNIEYELAFPEIANPRATDLDDYYVLNVPDKHRKKVAKILKEFSKNNHVDDIELNESFKIKTLKGEEVSSTKRKYGANDPGIDQQWGFDKMEVDKLYDKLNSNEFKPKKKALIAILDTGVDSKHEDIRDKFKSTRPQYNVDKQTHGTHCAGIAAAVSNNKKGIASLSPNNDYVEVTSIKVLSDNGTGTQAGIIRGIIEAADNGADVISMSLGGRSTDPKQRAYKKAVKYANEKGAIIIAAAGNNGRNAKNIAPACTPGIIAVSAVDVELNKAPFSNHIADLEMGVAAPGVNIYSTVPNDKYASYNGTSMATPYVAGLVGIMKAIKPNLTTKEVYKILNSSGKDTNSSKQTGKFIQPAKALDLLK